MLYRAISSLLLRDGSKSFLRINLELRKNSSPASENNMKRFSNFNFKLFKLSVEEWGLRNLLIQVKKGNMLKEFSNFKSLSGSRLHDFFEY